MLVKWDIGCECTMRVLYSSFDQYRVIYRKQCKEHKSDNAVRTVWKHQTIPA
jgi:hypothetical protein